MIKKIFTWWMETDSTKDPFMDNIIRFACMSFMAWLLFQAVNGVIS
jgi:hypothetical protein